MSKKPINNNPITSSQPPRFFCASDADWGGFINVRMTEELKERFYEWLGENQKHIIPSMIDMQSQGLKFTLSWDHENVCFIVTVTGALLAPYPERYCITSRAGEMSDAIGLAVWKHYELTKGDYGAYRPQSGGFGNFG